MSKASSASTRTGLTVGALGIVYGDIGTSPLYALRECFAGSRGVSPTPENVLGILSLVLWSLILIISVKYLGLLLRADNHGEGGLLALFALVRDAVGVDSARSRLLVVAGIAGTAMLYADAAITPAISVLSALEGLESTHVSLGPVIVPMAVVLLIALFVVQRLGTRAIAFAFGPIMLAWFLVIAILGVIAIVAEPSVIAAVNPLFAARFFAANGGAGFLVLGAVFLVITGGEALYADMGHFGKRPIRLAWYGLVLPSLLLAYFGQGAYLIAHPEAVDKLFFRLAPEWLLLPLVILATLATLIASQAVISGAFSLTAQAVQLGFLPRLYIRHTSAETAGRIYVPGVNWLLLGASVFLVLGFERSGGLADAYGIAVAGAMLLTTVFLYDVAVRIWCWPRAVALPIVAAYLLLTGGFFAATLAKISTGGWVPVLGAGIVYLLLSTWYRGRKLYESRVQPELVSVATFLDDVRRGNVVRVPGTAAFLTRHRGGVPRMLLHNLKHNGVLHERTWLVTVITESVPWVINDRVRIESLGEGMSRLLVSFGFLEYPDLPAALGEAGPAGLSYVPNETSFFLGHDTVLVDRDITSPMPRWRRRLFAAMARLAESAPAFFRLPPGRVVELGAQVRL